MNQFRPSPDAGGTRRQALGLLGAGLASLSGLAAGPALAQAPRFPHRVVRIVPFGSPGGPMDVIARIYAEKLKLRWNQPVIVEARPGASGTIAADAVAKAAPDGYTVLLMLPLTHINNVVLQPKLPYDPVKDFEPLSQLASGGPMLIARAASPFSNVREFVAYAKAHPGVYAPAKTPQPVLDEWSGALREITKMPDVQERLVGFGFEPLGSTPAEFRANYKADFPRVADLIKAAGVTPE